MLEGVKSKNLPAVLTFVEFSKGFRLDSQGQAHGNTESLWNT